MIYKPFSVYCCLPKSSKVYLNQANLNLIEQRLSPKMTFWEGTYYIVYLRSVYYIRLFYFLKIILYFYNSFQVFVWCIFNYLYYKTKNTDTSFTRFQWDLNSSWCAIFQINNQISQTFSRTYEKTACNTTTQHPHYFTVQNCSTLGIFKFDCSLFTFKLWLPFLLCEVF